MRQRVAVGTIDTSWGCFGAAFSEVGLGRLTFPGEPTERCVEWVWRWMPQAVMSGDDPRLADLETQLGEYLAGERRVFDVPLDPRGTPFQIAVWRELLNIPHGQTRSYQDVAVAIGRPTAVRAVGAANGSNPIPIIIPCHRVIGRDGSLTGYGGGLPMKERLLCLEGVRLGEV